MKSSYPIVISVTKFLEVISNYNNIITSRVNKYPKVDELESLISIYMNNMTDIETEEQEISTTNNIAEVELTSIINNSNCKIKSFNKKCSYYQAIMNETDFYSHFTVIYKNFQSQVYSKLNFFSEDFDEAKINFLNFNSTKDFISFLRLYFNYDSIENNGLLFFFKEIWILLRIFGSKLLTPDFNFNSLSIEINERMMLFFYSYYKENPFKEDYYLHKAVIEENIKEVYLICSKKNKNIIYSHINESDFNGNSPLLLALKMKNYDLSEVLCDHNANIKKKYSNELTPLEFAIAIKDKNALKILITGLKKQRFFNWEENLMKIHKYLKLMPNFKLELKLTFDSNILSILKTFTPNDSFTIYKKEGSIKIDMNISKAYFVGLKGCFSILIQERGNRLNVFRIDYEKKLCVDFFNYLLTQTNDIDIENEVNNIIKDGQKTKKTILKNLTLEELPIQNINVRNIFKTKYHTRPYTTKGELILTTSKIRSLTEKEVSSSNLNMSIYNKNYSCKEVVYLKFNNINNQIINTDIHENSTVKKVNKREELLIDYSNDILMSCLSKRTLVKNEKKNINLMLFFSDNFPLKLTHILPLVHVLSLISNEFDVVKQILSSDTLPFNQLPIKISFPIGMSFYGLFEVASFTDEDPSDSVFEVNFETELTDFNNNDNNVIEPVTIKKSMIKKNLTININQINNEFDHEEKIRINNALKDRNIFFNSEEVADSSKCILLKEMIKGQKNNKSNLILPYYKDMNNSKAYVDFQQKYFQNVGTNQKTNKISFGLPNEKINKTDFSITPLNNKNIKSFSIFANQPKTPVKLMSNISYSLNKS
jgi:hypothetical protein